MNKNTQILKGRLSQLLGWLPHHGNPSKPNKSAVLEQELNCSIDLNLAVGWDMMTDKDTWVIQDIGSSGNIVLLMDYSAVVTFDILTEEFHHYYTVDGTFKDIWACFSADEQKFVVLIKGY